MHPRLLKVTMNVNMDEIEFEDNRLRALCQDLRTQLTAITAERNMLVEAIDYLREYCIQLSLPEVLALLPDTRKRSRSK